MGFACLLEFLSDSAITRIGLRVPSSSLSSRTDPEVFTLPLADYL